MTMAAAIESRTAETAVQSKPGRLAGVEILRDLTEAEAIWRGLEAQRYFATPYQRFDLLSGWQREVGERESLRPFIVVGYDAQRRPLLLLPLALRRHHGVRVACFMGGRHTTFNMALCDRDFAATASAADVAALLSAIRQRSAVDVLALTQQPRRWRDLPNPMAMLPNQPSINDCPVLTMVPGAPAVARISHSIRRRLKAKERKLQALPGYRYRVATTEPDIDRLLDWFFRVKPLRMASQKLPDVFREPGVADFIRSACHLPGVDGSRIIDMHALECDDEVIAMFAGVADGDRVSMMFNTYTTSERARHSPGLILIRHIVDHYAERGFRVLDLGIGSDDYKRQFCKSNEPIFDCFIPLNARGRLAAAAMSGINRAKHAVKHTPALLHMAQRLRGTLR
jgi:CelD/BcsL family acetyltransferase involved in cellulose biosynthesis